MSRSFVNVTWNNAAENYDGTQQQNHHFNPNGSAAIHSYSDEAVTKKPQNKAPIASRIIPAQHTLNRVDQQERELDKAYENGEIDQEEYEELLHCLEMKRERAHKALCKAIGKPLEDAPVGQHTLDPENVSESLKTQQDSYFLLKSSVRIEKNVKDDALFFLIGAVVCFSLLMWLTN